MIRFKPVSGIMMNDPVIAHATRNVSGDITEEDQSSITTPEASLTVSLDRTYQLVQLHKSGGQPATCVEN